MSYIEFQNITKEYNTGGNAIFALKDASFSVEKGELAIILGASGAGKTTALNILGGMDTATSGHVMVDGSDITTYGKKQLTQYRRTDIGFVFQFYNLVPNLMLCDEPTGALDYNTGKQILQLLQDTCRREKITVLIITHNSALAPMADRLIQFKNGTVISETSNPTPVPIAEIEW